MRISDWSSDVCSSDLDRLRAGSSTSPTQPDHPLHAREQTFDELLHALRQVTHPLHESATGFGLARCIRDRRRKLHVLDDLVHTRLRRLCFEPFRVVRRQGRSEEHTSELQSLMRLSYAVFCLKKKTQDII